MISSKATLLVGAIAVATVAFGTVARADFAQDSTPVGSNLNLAGNQAFVVGDGFVTNTGTFQGNVGAEIINFQSDFAGTTANGNATIFAGAANPNDGAITTLWIQPADDSVFNEFSFRGALATSADQNITVTIYDQNGTAFVFFPIPITDNGNFTRVGFTAIANSGETISLIKITGSPGFDDFKQMGFGTAADNGGGGGNGAVPEPSTWAMMLLGFFGVGFMAYRRRRSDTQFRAV